MGNEQDAYPADGEGPVREVFLSSFAISSTAVTNEEFKAFVADTNYVTTAEQSEDGSPPWSFVFAGLLPDDFRLLEVFWVLNGGGRSKVLIGCILRVLDLSWSLNVLDGIILLFIFHGLMQRRLPNGLVVVCRLKPNGNSQLVVISTRNDFLGVMKASLVGILCATFLLVLFLTKTMLKMGGLELVLLMLFLQIILVFITVQGTFGSGVMIGFPHVMNQISRSETRRAL